jgi:DNA-3-methyladenine glycosylase I
MNKNRCHWATTHELFPPYHDKEWGKPVHDDRELFERLNLEGAQAGLSWLTILKKRAEYRRAFERFNAKKIAGYDAKKKAALMKNDGIVRNKLKIQAVVENAKAYLAAQKEFGSFDKYIWGFVDGKPLPHSRRKEALLVGERMSKELKKRGFRFVGATICYAFMQAVGMVHDHEPGCFLYKKVVARKEKATRK